MKRMLFMRRISPPMRKLSRMITGTSAGKPLIEKKVASRLERLPGVDADSWTNVQENYQLRQAEKQSSLLKFADMPW